MHFKMGVLGPQVLAQVDPHTLVDANSNVNANKACSSTIMAMDIEKDMFLVGDIFMRKFYTIFDRDHDRVGLAEANTSDKVKQLTQGKEKK